MKPIEKNDLEQKIAFLKNKQQTDLLELKNQYHSTLKSCSPINLIKSSFLDAIATPDTGSNLIHKVIGLGTTFLAKNVWNENTANPIKRVLGKVLKFVVKKRNQAKSTVFLG
ncbi:MAG: hypothetical protein ACRC6O_12505 [Flavobacterium sp.]